MSLFDRETVVEYSVLLLNKITHASEHGLMSYKFLMTNVYSHSLAFLSYFHSFRSA